MHAKHLAYFLNELFVDMQSLPVIVEMFLWPGIVPPGATKRSPWVLGRKEFCRGKSGRGRWINKLQQKPRQEEMMAEPGKSRAKA